MESSCHRTILSSRDGGAEYRRRPRPVTRILADSTSSVARKDASGDEGAEMNASAPLSFAQVFAISVRHELDDARGKIVHCLHQISDDELWWRPDESQNSIANLILHNCGNLRQWVVSGVGGSADRRNRPHEFAQRDRIPRAHLFEMLETVTHDACQTLAESSEQRLLQQMEIQGFELTGMQAAIESVAHFRGHTQEIIHMTRAFRGDDYQFRFVPGPNQQGGAAS